MQVVEKGGKVIVKIAKIIAVKYVKDCQNINIAYKNLIFYCKNTKNNIIYKIRKRLSSIDAALKRILAFAEAYFRN